MDKQANTKRKETTMAKKTKSDIEASYHGRVIGIREYFVDRIGWTKRAIAGAVRCPITGIPMLSPDNAGLFAAVLDGALKVNLIISQGFIHK